jgi:aminopeptidase N
MKHIVTLLSSILLITAFGACKSTQTQTDIAKEENIEVRELDTLTVSTSKKEEVPNEAYPKEVYRASSPRIIDIIHTKLDLGFDFQGERVLGEAWIDFTPIFDPVTSFELDAQYFDIHSISTGQGREVEYYYQDSLRIIIDWPEVLERNDTAQIYIDYTAVPGRKAEGGSSAISSNRGLFFINPQGTVPNKPTQIWTQGETEHNSNWFPTQDQPNERCTQEITLTVPIKYKTLSNGILLKSEVLNDSMRRDHWAQDLPHAPYLFMLAIGDFAIVQDSWEDIDLAYYVEPEYKADAPQIFDHTPEMLSYFSDLLKYKYPWPKYDQVIVRDFVSGAMENTGAVVFGDFVQKHQLDLPGNDNDFIVAHEMFHHWFGDLVTCESWSNLTMNEGFANYSEYLWKEYKEGRDQADHHRSNQIAGYLAEARQKKRPIVDFEYLRPEDMFDAHSYNKGGLVMHMLRHYLGTEKFFAGLNLYLKRHEYSAVETHHLRLAMEDISGEDLNWFFNQWFYEAGHPQLDIRQDFTDGQLTLIVEQTQNTEKEPAIFTLPTSVDIYDAQGKKQNFEITIDQRQSTFVFEMEEEPSLVIFDPRDILLAEVQDSKSHEQYALQYQMSSTFRHRVKALKELKSAPKDIKEPIVNEALSDAHWSIRREGLLALTQPVTIDHLNTVRRLAVQDPAVQVRVAALNVLKKLSDNQQELAGVFQARIDAKEAGLEMGAALELWYAIDSAAALAYAQQLESVKSELVERSIAKVYAETGNPKFIGFYDRLLPKQSGFTSFPFFNAYSKMIAQLEGDALMKRILALQAIGGNASTSRFTRYAATKAISDTRKELAQNEAPQSTLDEIQSILKDIISNESSPRLKAMYSNF